MSMDVNEAYAAAVKIISKLTVGDTLEVGMCCWECGTSGVHTHKHHVVPRSRGGTKTIRLCEECHGKVHRRKMATSSLTREALQAKKARGERTGSIPFGYRLAEDGVHLEEEPAEQEKIRDIVCYRWGGKRWCDVLAVARSRGVPDDRLPALLQWIKADTPTGRKRKKR